LKPLKALAWPALTLCLAPVSAHAALIPPHPHRPPRSAAPIVRPAAPIPVNSDGAVR